MSVSTRTPDLEREIAHRPWPLPSVPWVMFQSWRQLLFAHWRVPAAVLRPLVPKQLLLDEFDGSAWVGLTPFNVTNLRARYLPALPGLSDFPEMNLRTYVRHEGRGGVFFFSLDAGSSTAVTAARAIYRLPYFEATMSCRREGGWIHYQSRREGTGVEFRGRYRPVGSVFQSAPGSLEYFLTERYALFTVLRSGRVLRGDIHHAPWRLNAAEAIVEHNTVASAQGVPLFGEAPILHYAERQDTLIWAPTG